MLCFKINMFYLFYFNSWSDWHVCISEYLCTLLFCGSLKYIKQDHFLSSKVSKCEMCITFLLLSMIDGAAVKMKARSKTQPLKILTIWYSHLFSPCYPVRILLFLSHVHIVWWDLPYKHVDILILEWNVSGCIYDVYVCTHVHACAHMHTSSVTPFVFPLLYSCLCCQYAVCALKILLSSKEEVIFFLL